jgi:hypothetical protein
MDMTPWARAALNEPGRDNMRAAVPDGHILFLSGKSSHGPFIARLVSAAGAEVKRWEGIRNLYAVTRLLYEWRFPDATICPVCNLDVSDEDAVHSHIFDATVHRDCLFDSGEASL